MKRAAQVLTVLCVVVLSMFGTSTAASADSGDAVGCTKDFKNNISYNPHDPVPQVIFPGGIAVVVDANGTFAYVQDDVSDVGIFVNCVV